MNLTFLTAFGCLLAMPAALTFAEAPREAARREFARSILPQKDGLIRISQGVHAHLKQHDIPHVWHVDGNGHAPTHWANSLYWFAGNIFQPAAAPAAALAPVPAAPARQAGTTLRSAYQDHFLIGAALNQFQVSGRNARAAEIAARQFSSVTAENDMKWQSVHPERGRYRFENADAYLKFAEKHDMKVIGHTLVWHSQTPGWVFKGEGGRDATRDELLALMKEHIMTVAGRYKGRIHGWDVVNEALSDGGPDILRDSPWRRIIGEDFLDHAFRFAREAAPGAELYYNDYGLENPRKRANCIKLVKGMLERGVPIDGIGTQSHFHLNHPSLDDIEKTITAFAALGLKVMVTELDVDVLPDRGPGGADISRREQAGPKLNPYTDGLPAEVQERLAKRYADIFRIYLRHSDSITRVTFWGLDDGSSWLNGFPIRGRTNHPLLIDRKLEPKPAFFTVLKLPKEAAASH
ncbi:MAG: endo-1,4-beta-xylanase [Akkermansiaceae bacterium]|nr:endo-1,4-beta-xylanase [Akkermansiaceae bacterium]